MAKRKKKAVAPKVSKKKKSDVPQEDESKPVSTDRPPSSAKKMAATSSTSQLEDELVQVPCFNTVTLGNSTKTDSGDVSHFWCKYCEFSAGSMQELVPHMGQHIIKCSYCSFNSFSRSEVAKHCKSEHDKDLKLTPQELELSSGDYDMDKDPCSACMFCDFMTYSTMHLEMHTVTKHPGMHAKSVAKMITKQASAQVRKDDANFYQTMPNNMPESEKDGKVAEIVIDPEDVGSLKDIKSELSLGLLDIKPKQAVLQENLARESFLGKSVVPNSSLSSEKNSQKSSKDWAVKVEIMYCLSCPYSNAYIEKLKCHSLVQHPVGAGAVTFNALGELANAEDTTFFCVREDCSFSSGDCLSYQRHLMSCCSLHSSMSVLEKERLTSTISYILNYLKKFGIKEERGFTDFASVFGVVPISFQAKQSCPATSDSQNFLQPVHSSEHVYKYADQHKVSNQNLSGIEHSDNVLTAARPNSNNCQTVLRDKWKYVQFNSAPQSSSHVDVVSTSTLPPNNQQMNESHPQQQQPQYPLQQIISQSPYAPSNSAYNQPERLATSGSGLINPFPSDQRYNASVPTFQKPTQNYSSNPPLDPRVLNRGLPPSEPEPNRNSFEPQLLTQARQNLTHNDALLSLHNFNPNSNTVQEFPTSMNYQQNILQNNNTEVSYGQVIHSNLSSVPVNQAQNNIAGSYPLADGRDLNRPMVNPQERVIVSSQMGKTSIEQTLGNQSHAIPGYGSVQVQVTENQSLNLTGSHTAPASDSLQENSLNANKSGYVTQTLEKSAEESILQIPPATQQQNNGLTSSTAVDHVQENYDIHSADTLSSTSRLDMQTAPSQSNLPNFLTNTPMAAPEQGPETMTPPGLPPRSQPPRQPAPQGLVTPPKMLNAPGNVAGSSPLSPSIYLSGQAPRHRRTSWTDADMRPKGMLPPMHPRVMNPGIPSYPQGQHVRQRLFNPNSPRGYGGTGEATRGTRDRGRGRPVHYSRPVDDDDVIVVGEQFRQRPPLRGRGVPLNYARGAGQTPPRFSKPITSNRAPNQRGAPPPKVFDISKHFEDLACVVNSTGEDEEVGRGDEDLQIVGVTLPNDKSSQPKAVDASQFSFCCVHCGKDQGSKNVMKQHMKVSHNDTLLGAFTSLDTGQLLFFCPQLTCEFMTYDESRLSEHLTKCYNLDSAKSVDFETAIKNLKSLKIRQLDVRSMGSHDNPIHLDGQGMKDNFSSSLNDAFDDIVVNTSGRHIAKQLTPKHPAPQTQRNPPQNCPFPRGPPPVVVPLRQQGYPGMRQRFPVGPYRMGRPNATVNRPTGLRNMRQHQPAMHPNYRHPSAGNVHPGMGVRGMYPPRVRPQFVRAPPPPYGQQASQAGGEQEPIVIDIDEDDDDSLRKGSASESASSHGQYLHNGQMAGFSVPAGNTVPDAEQMSNGNLTTGPNPEIAVRDNFLKESYSTYGKASQLPTMSQQNFNNNGRNSFQNHQGGTRVPIRDSVNNQQKFDRHATNLFDGSPVMHSFSQSFDQVDPTAALQMVVKSFPKLQLPNQETESPDYYNLLKQNTDTGDNSYPQRQNAESGSTNDSPVPYIVENNHCSSSLDDSVSESYPYEDSQSTSTESTLDQQNSQSPRSVSETVRGQDMLNTSTESAVVTEGNASSSQGIATLMPVEYFNDEEKMYAVVLEKVFAKVPNMPKHLSHRLVSKFKEYLNYKGVKISWDSNVIDEFVSKISYKGSSADKLGAKSLPHPPVLSQSEGATTSSPGPNEGDEPSDSAGAPDSHEPPISSEPPSTADQTCNLEQPYDHSEENPSSEPSSSHNDLSDVITTQVILAERKIQFPGFFSKAPVNLTAINKRTAISACEDRQLESTCPSNASLLSAEDLHLKLVNEGIKDYLGKSTADEDGQRDYVWDGDCKKANDAGATSVDGLKDVGGNATNLQDRSSRGDNAHETFPVSRPSNLQESCDSNSLETHPSCQASGTQDHLTRDNNLHEITSEIEKLDNQETSSVQSHVQKDDKENTDKKFLPNQSKAPARRFSASVIGERVSLCKVRRSGSFPVNLSTVGQSLSERPSKNEELTSPKQVLPELASHVRSVSTPLSKELRMGLEVCIPSAPYFTQECPTLSLKEVSYPSPTVCDKSPILITSSVDYLVSGHADLEVDIAGKPDDSRLLHVGKLEPPDHEFEHDAGIVSEGNDRSGAKQKKRRSQKPMIKGTEPTVSSGLTRNNNGLKSPEKKISQPKKRGSDLKSNIRSRFVDQKTGKLILKVSKKGRPRKLAESHEKGKRDSSDVKISAEVDEKILEEVKEKILEEVKEKILEEVKEKIPEDDLGKAVAEEDKKPIVEKTTLEPSNELISELSVRRSDRKRKIIQSDYRGELADIDELLSDSDDEYKIDDEDSGSDCKWKTDSGHSNVLKKRFRKAKEPPDLTAFNTSTKGKFKCWLCKKTFLKCMGGKAHIIKKHKQGFCTIDMAQLEETNQLHLLLYCPRECKYATFSLDGLQNHLISCKKPLYKENGENWLEINTNFIDTLYPELLKTGVNDLLGASNAKPATKDPAKVVKRKRKKSTSECVTSTSSVIISHGEAKVTVKPEDDVIKVLTTSVEKTTSSIKAGVATQATGSVAPNISCDTFASSAKSSSQSLDSVNHIPVVSRPPLVASSHQHKLSTHDVPLDPQRQLTQTASMVQAQFVQRKFSPLPHPSFAYSQNAHTNNVHSQVLKSQQNNARFVTSSTWNNAPRFSQLLPVAPAASSSSKQMPPSLQQQQLRFEQSRFPSRLHHPGFFDSSSPVNRQYSNPIPRPNHLVKEGTQSHKPIVKAMGKQEAYNVPHNPAVAKQCDDKQSSKGQDSDIYMIEDNGTICIE